MRRARCRSPMPPPRPERQTARLLLGRVSAPVAIYFLTICTEKRAPVLTSPAALAAVCRALTDTFSSSGRLHAACVMPDHVHLLFTLGARLSIGQVMGKLKTLARLHATADWTWQDNGYEHRLRDSESEEDYAFYVFMNPYRAGLVPIDATWPGWICEDTRRYRFLAGTNADGTPPPEWLVRHDEITANIVLPP